MEGDSNKSDDVLVTDSFKDPDGRAVIGAELPAGEYEAFLHNAAGNLSADPGAVSERVKFDVIEPVAR